MSTARSRPFDDADEVTTFPNGENAIVSLEGITYTKGTFQPGWRWSHDVKPIAGTERCQFHHRGYIVRGRIGIRMSDGATVEMGPDAVVDIPPGHDGWVIGDEPVVMIEFGGGEAYGKPPSS